MIIEIVGLPGSGKTTLITSLLHERQIRLTSVGEIMRLHFSESPSLSILKRLAMRYHSVDRVLAVSQRLLLGHTHGYALEYLNDHPDVEDAIWHTIGAARGLSLSNTLSLARKFHTLLANLFVMQQQAYINKRIVVDEGFFVQIANIQSSFFTDTSFIDRYYSTIPVPDVLIYVECDNEISIERLHARDCSNGVKLENFNREFYSSLEYAYCRGLKWLMRRGVRIIHVTSKKSAMEELIEFFQSNDLVR